MLDVTSDQAAALAARRVVRRTFVYCIAKDPDTLLPSPAGFWDDLGNVEIGGLTYYGTGSLVQVGTLTALSDLSIPGIEVTLSGLKAAVAALVRGSTVGQAPITVSLGLFDPDTRNLVGGLIRRFSGFVDTVNNNRPKKGDVSVVSLTCESTSRALTIRRSDTRSQASQQQRDPTDGFYNYTGLQREKPIYFGQATPA